MKKRLSKKQMRIFAVGQLGWSILGGIISAWLVTYFIPTSTEVNALIPTGAIFAGLTVIGLITAGSRLWDAVSDPLVANWSDRCRSPKGRRFPFMKWAAIPFAVVTILLFMIPAIIGPNNQGANIAVIIVLIVMFYTAMTCYCTPYNALISEFGEEQEDRMYISTSISLTYFAGTMLAYTPFIFAGIIQNAGIGYYWSYIICFAVLAVVAVVCMLIPTICLKETDFINPTPTDSHAFRDLKLCFKNKDFVTFAISDLMYWIGLTMFQTGLPFFVKISMQLPEMWSMILMGVMTVLSACFYPFVNRFVKKFGKKKLVITGFIGLSVAYVLAAVCGPIINGGNWSAIQTGEANIWSYVFGIAICIIAAIPMALLGVIPQSMVADVAEADAIKTKENKQGMFFAARTFSMKLGQTIAMILVTSLFLIGGHVTSDGESIPTVLGLVIVGGAAIVFCLLGAFVLGFYNEKKVMKEISKENRDAQEAQSEPHEN